MLDIKFIRNNPEKVQEALKNRKSTLTLDNFLDLEGQRRSKLAAMEELKAKANSISKEIGKLKKAGQDASHIIDEVASLKSQVKEAEELVRDIEAKLEQELLYIPNVPHESVPVGKDEEDNLEIKKWGEIREFSFEPKAHYDIGESLDILDFERAAKVTGTRFTFYKGLGARLERAVINFFLDTHTEKHGYQEILPPFIANKDSMIATGQLPKFAEDMFKLEGTDYYLIPTAEVPVTNIFRGEILDNAILPKKFCAYSACFRAEAGSAGRDTRGLIRQHQFNKVELVKFSRPEESYDELEKLTRDAERILEALQLPYRRVVLSTGDVGFSSAKTYDLEVWLPSFNCYREISSCSNFEDFQARRGNIRFRRDANSKPEFVHTLNGSGLAVGRTVTAIIENYQQEDGSILVPKVLIPYMGGVEVIK